MSVDHSDATDIVMDAQDILSHIKHLNEAIYLAAQAIGNDRQMNPITMVANIIDDKLGAVREMLDAARKTLPSESE